MLIFGKTTAKPLWLATQLINIDHAKCGASLIDRYIMIILICRRIIVGQMMTFMMADRQTNAASAKMAAAMTVCFHNSHVHAQAHSRIVKGETQTEVGNYLHREIHLLPREKAARRPKLSEQTRDMPQ